MRMSGLAFLCSGIRVSLTLGVDVGIMPAVVSLSVTVTVVEEPSTLVRTNSPFSLPTDFA